MDKQRLDKVLANMGFGSRSEIKKRIRNGEIEVNGKIVKDSGLHVMPTEDHILINGTKLSYQKYIYIMLNKPAGVISATEDHRERTVIDLLDKGVQHFRPFPVGRLDKDTVGLLLLTNDGQLAHELLSPRKRVDKTYIADIDGPVGPEAVEAFLKGVELDDGYVTLPADLQIIASAADRSHIELTIREGKFHQVKRMFRAIGREVLYLKRIRMGTLRLDEELDPGEYRELREDELALLQGNNESS